ncbi:MAG TPA: hypothetical protein VFA18_21935, partial [Gemmataceae bacterium]|nr:hypothetical protein [Gemmataceae bacterium]
MKTRGAEQLRRDLLQKAVAAQTRIFVAQAGEQPAERAEQARNYFLLADMERILGHLPQAEQALHQALTIQEELAAQFPDEPHFQQALALSLNLLGLVYRDTRRPEEARRV